MTQEMLATGERFHVGRVDAERRAVAFLDADVVYVPLRRHGSVFAFIVNAVRRLASAIRPHLSVGAVGCFDLGTQPDPASGVGVYPIVNGRLAPHMAPKVTHRLAPEGEPSSHIETAVRVCSCPTAAPAEAERYAGLRRPPRPILGGIRRPCSILGGSLRYTFHDALPSRVSTPGCSRTPGFLGSFYTRGLI